MLRRALDPHRAAGELEILGRSLEHHGRRGERLVGAPRARAR